MLQTVNKGKQILDWCFIYVQNVFFLSLVDDPDFKAGIQSLSMILQVPPYQDHLEQLKVRILEFHKF